jgi:hypothetical protein
MDDALPGVSRLIQGNDSLKNQKIGVRYFVWDLLALPKTLVFANQGSQGREALRGPLQAKLHLSVGGCGPEFLAFCRLQPRLHALPAV